MLKPLTRIVSADKTIKSPLLNRLGVQVFRTVAARSIYRLGRSPDCSQVKQQVEELRREGAVLIPNFLPPEQFEAVKAEAAAYMQAHQAELTVLQHGPNQVRKITMTGRPESGTPAIFRFFRDPRLRAILSAAEKRNFNEQTSHLAIEHLIQGAGDVHDPETDLHSDIFFDTHKAWFYLTDVTPADGPLQFVKRSHLLTSTQLGYVYRESCGGNMGSRRITPEELKRLGLEETSVAVPKNTLVVANVFGYHRRIRGVPGHERMALHVSLRVNPFLRWFRR